MMDVREIFCLAKKELLFTSLTSEHIREASSYFEANPKFNKYSRKQSQLLDPFSFIVTINGMFAISNSIEGTLGHGSSGRVKIGKNINTGQLVAIKRLLSNECSPVDYNDLLDEEVNILCELGQLHATAERWWNNVEGSKLSKEDDGWINKYEKDPEYMYIRYNYKFYIFSMFFDGITLYKHFKQYALTTEKTLQIIIKVLEKLEILNSKGIVHADFSFSNILYKKNGEIEIIDFGLAGKLQNGIKKFPVLKYKFTEKSYISPESDYRQVLHEIIPQSKAWLYCTSQIYIIHEIDRLAKEGYGFNTITSDLYSLGWCIYHQAGGKQNPVLRELQQYTYISNPFKRELLQFVLGKYKEKLAWLGYQHNFSTLQRSNLRVRISSSDLGYALRQNNSSDSMVSIGLSLNGLRQNNSNDSLGYSSSSNELSSDRLDDPYSSVNRSLEAIEEVFPTLQTVENITQSKPRPRF